MATKQNVKLDDMWEFLVASVCEEHRAGALAFGDAVEDLFLLGFDSGETRERLLAGAPAGRMDRKLLELLGAEGFVR